MDIRIITAIGSGIVAVGVVAAVTLLPNQQKTESKPLIPAQIVEQQPESAVATVEDNSEFQTMAVEPDKPQDCSLPKPPRNIGDSALTRNSLRQIMRLIALQKWKKTDSCECFYNQISWDDVIAEAPNFERTDGINLRFDLSDLRTQADELEQQNLEVCSQ